MSPHKGDIVGLIHNRRYLTGEELRMHLKGYERNSSECPYPDEPLHYKPPKDQKPHIKGEHDFQVFRNLNKFKQCTICGISEYKEK